MTPREQIVSQQTGLDNALEDLIRTIVQDELTRIPATGQTVRLDQEFASPGDWDDGLLMGGTGSTHRSIRPIGLPRQVFDAWLRLRGMPEDLRTVAAYLAEAANA